MATGAVVTTVGNGLIASTMLTQSVAKYLRQGTGTGTPAAGDVALGTASTDAIVAGTQSNPTATKYRVAGTVPAGLIETVSEVGLFDDAVATNLLYREVFAGVALLPNDGITYTIDIVVG